MAERTTLEERYLVQMQITLRNHTKRQVMTQYVVREVLDQPTPAKDPMTVCQEVKSHFCVFQESTEPIKFALLLRT
jgi:hypothetical protein